MTYTEHKPATAALELQPVDRPAAVEYITDPLVTSDRPAMGHFFVTLGSVKNGAERGIDILISQNSFARLCQVLRQSVSYEWEILQWHDVDEPF